MEPTDHGAPEQAHLGLWDAVSIILGIVIGAGIYETAPTILANVPSAWAALGVWVLGGVLALVGALCFAELAAAYPHQGGEYVYLGRAFGPFTGFLYGWAQLVVILTSNVGAMAFVFAVYAARLWGLPSGPGTPWPFVFAATAVTVLTLLNLTGVRSGRRTQNLLTGAKVLGLGGILIAGLGWGKAAGLTAAPLAEDAPGLGLAMILVLFTYGGWNHSVFVAAEVHEPRRNLPRALVLGTAGITLIYVLINLAYIWGLGFEGARQSEAVAADVLSLALGEAGSKAMCLVVMVSALGAINAGIFTGARLFARLGAEHGLFPRQHPPRRLLGWAFVVEALITLAMLAVVSTPAGQGVVNVLLGWVSLPPVRWTGHGGFETLVTCSAPVFWSFFLLTGLALFVLRRKDVGVARPFRVPLYPLSPLVFCATCAFLVYASVTYVWRSGLAGGLLLLALVPVAAGVPVYLWSKR